MSRTRRQQLAEYLAQGPITLPELADLLGVPLRHVVDDLAHLQRSHGDRLQVTPAECPRCGRVFHDRTRLTRPSRCPDCKHERLSWPRLLLDE